MKKFITIIGVTALLSLGMASVRLYAQQENQNATPSVQSELQALGAELAKQNPSPVIVNSLISSILNADPTQVSNIINLASGPANSIVANGVNGYITSIKATNPTKAAAVEATIVNAPPAFQAAFLASGGVIATSSIGGGNVNPPIAAADNGNSASVNAAEQDTQQQLEASPN